MSDYKPLVTASAGVESVDLGTMDGRFRHRTAGVSIEVTFELGAHDDALASLEGCIDRVKAQIADAAEGRSL